MEPKYPIKARNSTTGAVGDVQTIEVPSSAFETGNAGINLAGTFATRAVASRTVTASTTLLASDVGRTIYFSSTQALTCTVPSTTVLGTNFICTVVNIASVDGTVTFVPSGGSDVTIRNNDGDLSVGGKVTMEATGVNEYLISPALT